MADDPWKEFNLQPPQSTPKDDPWKEFDLKPPSTEEPKSYGLADFFKSIPRGLLSGAAGAASALGQSEANLTQPPEMAKAVPGREKSTELLEQNLTGPLHKPESRWGRYGATTGEFLGNPASYVGPGGPILKAASAITGGLGSEAAGQATEGTALEPYARVAGGLAGMGVPRAAPYAAVPIAHYMKDNPTAAAVAGFGAKRVANALGLPSEFADFAGDYALAKILKKWDPPAKLDPDDITKGIKEGLDPTLDTWTKILKERNPNMESDLGIKKQFYDKIEKPFGRSGPAPPPAAPTPPPGPTPTPPPGPMPRPGGAAAGWKDIGDIMKRLDEPAPPTSGVAEQEAIRKAMEALFKNPPGAP
jgi:hypothetical protein